MHAGSADDGPREPDPVFAFHHSSSPASLFFTGEVDHFQRFRNSSAHDHMGIGDASFARNGNAMFSWTVIESNNAPL
jgi:hypothetical protein